MFKGRQFDQSVILLCVRWYLTYNLSLRDLEEMMAERGKRGVTGKWHVDESYIKVCGYWMYLYRAIDSVGDAVEFLSSEQRDLPSAKRFFRKALQRHGRADRVVIDGSQTNREARRLLRCDKSTAGSLPAPTEANPDPQESILEQSD